jgi:hypothetical protein
VSKTFGKALSDFSNFECDGFSEYGEHGKNADSDCQVTKINM